MKKQRRSVWQWLADKAGVQARLTRDEWLSAFRQGAATIILKPAYMSTGEYRDMLTEQASGAYARLLAPRPVELVEPKSATYEPPEKQADPMRKTAYVERIRTQHALPRIPPLGARQRAQQRNAE